LEIATLGKGETVSDMLLLANAGAQSAGDFCREPLHYRCYSS